MDDAVPPDTTAPATPRPSRRAGGRHARKAMRAAGPAVAAAAPGQTGGSYRPLRDADVPRVHQAVLDVLANIGMGQVPDEVRDLAVARGCPVTDSGRVLFPRSFVEDVIAGACRSLTLYGQDPGHDLEIGGRRVHYGTGGAAVRVLDPATDTYRPSTLADLYDFARLADRLDNISWFTRCVVATDVPDIYDLDINTAYAIACGTTKPVGTSFSLGEHVEPVVALFDRALGGDGDGARFRARPFCKAHISPVVSPLRYGEDAVGVTRAAIASNMTINTIIAAQSGATAPAPPAGMLVQSVAETLAGLILVTLFKPGHPVIFSNWPFVIDLRTGAFSGGGGEIAVLNAAAAQMGNFYDLPSGVSASMTDSKLPDAQAGYEKAMTTVTAGLAGANLVYESGGMFASLLGASFEGLVVDNEMLGQALRVVRGLEISDDTIGLDVIREVVEGPGHFLGHDQTIAAMERDYLYPDLGDRDAPDVWAEAGRLDMRARARARCDSILTDHHPRHVTAAIDADLRARFDIKLPAERRFGSRLTGG